MKRILPISLVLVYIAALLAGFVLLFKPGASFFYAKSVIGRPDITTLGNAYAYRLPVNTRLFNPETVLVLEDQQVMEKASYDYLQSGIGGAYALDEVRENGVSVLFMPADRSNPVTNGHAYAVYIRPFIVSSNVGGLAVLVLLLGLAAFLWPLLTDPTLRKSLLERPSQPGQLWTELSERSIFARADRAAKPALVSRGRAWGFAAVNTTLLAFVFIFMEWGFQVTKPSFMDAFSLGEKGKILLISGLAFSLLALMAQLLIFLIDLLVSPVFPAFRKYGLHIPATLIAASLSLILLDNFTYTIFRFGVVDSKTIVRIFYGLAFCAVWFYFIRTTASAAARRRKRSQKPVQPILAGALGGVSLLLAVLTFQVGNLSAAQAGQDTRPEKTPNIILLGADGLNADNLSLYGYERDTTPFLRSLSETSLTGMNHFTNAAHSQGSDTALLTGKQAFDTRVLFPPDTLRSADKYQHLPGLLKLYGYRTIQLGVPYYVDANAINFKNAFDSVNCAENPRQSFSERLLGFGYDDEIYLLGVIGERISQRLAHIFFIKDMENPYDMVTQPESDIFTDPMRLDCLRADLQNAQRSGQPLFAHIHLMGTHGPRFYASVTPFSAGQTQDTTWMTDFYDDAIFEFDQQVAGLVQTLKDQGQYENTILIIYTDHSQKNDLFERMPLVMHFPNGEHAASLSANTQNIDIAPTLLDYLGIERPGWMAGDSLIADIDPARLVIAGSTNKAVADDAELWFVPDEKTQPPFYQFSKMSVIQCQKWYLINLEDLSLSTGEIAGHTHPCAPELLDTPDEIRQKAGELLEQYDFQLPDDW